MNANSRSRGRGAGAVLVTLGLAAYGLLGVGAAEPAAAAPVSLNLTYSCVFPVIGKKQLKVAIKSDVPARLPVGVSMPRVVFDTTTTVPEDTANGLLSVGAETMEGGALAQAVLTVPEYPDGIAIKTGAQFPRTFIPPAGSFDVRAVGSTIGPGFVQPGKGKIVVNNLLLKPLLKDKDGNLTDLGDKLELDCVQEPGQNNTLAEFDVLPDADTQAPSRPGKPEVTKVTSSRVALSWGRATDDVEVAGYDVYNGTTIIGSVEGAATTLTLTGLTPQTTYDLTVRARDLSKNSSEASDPVTVRTPVYVPDVVPPTAPGTPTLVNNAASDAVHVAWGASTDDTEVTGYEVLAGGAVVGRTDGTLTDTWARGLTPGQTYALTVRARDEAGNISAPSPALTVRMPSGPPGDCGRTEYPGFKIRGCVFMAGFQNITKLKAAAALNDPAQDPVLTNIAYRVVRDEAAKVTDTIVKFAFNRPMRTRSTFLTFGFMPTTATMELTQVGAGDLSAHSPDGGDLTMRAHAVMSIRVFDVTVNGTPMNVGPNCRTSRPVELDLRGGSPEINDPLLGGPLRSTTDIPTFTGCGVGEDLSRIFNAAISGKQNYLKINLGPICRVNVGSCPPVQPVR